MSRVWIANFMYQIFKKTFKNKSQSGFLLVELIVALFIFSVVMTVGIGSIITIFDANKKAQSLQSVMNNLNLAMDSMTKALAVGTNYGCLAQLSSSDPETTNVGDCDGGLNPFGAGVSFLSQDDDIVTFEFSKSCFEEDEEGNDTAGCFMRTINDEPPVRLTAPEIRLSDVRFLVSGTAPFNPPTNDLEQPRVLIFIKGIANAGPRNKTTFSIQTAVSQRIPDL